MVDMVNTVDMVVTELVMGQFSELDIDQTKVSEGLLQVQLLVFDKVDTKLDMDHIKVYTH